MNELRTRSNFWYLLPIVLGILGGVIAYFAVRRDDPKLGKNCLIVGIVILAFHLVGGLVQ